VPNWQPNWQDVRWNYAAANLAAAELDRASDQLESTSNTRLQVSSAAATEWRGVYRRRFDQQVTASLRSAWQQAGEFRDAATRIRRATQWAREEQARREADRARWYREKAAEDAARARAARSRVVKPQAGNPSA
jgi:hypothetical protein